MLNSSMPLCMQRSFITFLQVCLSSHTYLILAVDDAILAYGVYKHGACFDDGDDMCREGLHARLPVNKFGLHYTVYAFAWKIHIQEAIFHE